MVAGTLQMVPQLQGRRIAVAGVPAPLGVGNAMLLALIEMLGAPVAPLKGVKGVGAPQEMGMMQGVGGGMPVISERMAPVKAIKLRGEPGLKEPIAAPRATELM